MSSTILVELNNIHLWFSISHYSNSVRDKLINSIRDPQSLFASSSRIVVANGLNLNIREGDRIAIIGKNGTGKTSLCRCVAGIYRPNKGSIKIKGTVSAIFEPQVGVYPDLTGRENALVLSHFLFPNIDKKQRSEIIFEALEFSELGNRLDTPFRLYSKGMQARLCLSLIVQRPAEIMILDEIFYGTDTFFKEKLERKMIDSVLRAKATILVSHHQQEINDLCNRAIVLKNGQIDFDGSPLEAWDHYTRSNNEHLSGNSASCQISS